MGAFGEKLRKQRETRGIALEAISSTTKISVRMLRALEDERFDQLPGGVFNKGFVRAYARHVGLDEEETLTAYFEALRGSQIPAQKTPPDLSPKLAKPDAAADPPSGVLSGNVVRDGNDRDSGNGTLGLGTAERRKQDRRHEGRRHEDRHSEDRHSEDCHNEDRHNENPRNGEGRAEVLSAGRRRPEPLHGEPEDSPQSLDAFSSPDSDLLRDASAFSAARVPWRRLGAALLLAAAALVFWNFHRRVGPAAAPPTASAPSQSVPSGSSSLQASTLAASQNSGESSPAAAAKLVPNPTAAASNASLTRSAALQPPATFTVMIRAEKTTWVSILADGKPVAEETLIAPANTTVRASREVVVKAGNAAGISFLLNGKLILTQGNDGEVKTYVLDASGLRSAPQPALSTPNP